MVTGTEMKEESSWTTEEILKDYLWALDPTTIHEVTIPKFGRKIHWNETSATFYPFSQINFHTHGIITIAGEMFSKRNDEKMKHQTKNGGNCDFQKQMTR